MTFTNSDITQIHNICELYIEFYISCDWCLRIIGNDGNTSNFKKTDKLCFGVDDSRIAYRLWPLSYPMVNLKVILESFPWWHWNVNVL